MAKTGSSQKKSNPKKYAIIGVWVSAITFLITILLLIVKLLSIAGIYTLPNEAVFNWILGGSSALVFIGLASFALLDPNRVRRLLTGRQARYGSNAAIMLIAFVGILLVVNILVINNPGKPYDLTEGKQNSLASQTLETLKALPSPVQATAFYSSEVSSEGAQKLLENYKTLSNGKFTYTFVDPVQYPLTARQAGITGDGKIYLQMGDQHEIVSYASEQELTSALIRLVNPGQQTIYFLTGHGERDILTSGDTSYSAARSALEAKNYTVMSLNLLATNKIPEDTTVIVIAGPLQPVSASEVVLLKDYVDGGGSLIIMEDPLPLTQFGNSIDPLADYLALNWGITFNNDIVVDTTTNNLSWAVSQLPYTSHPITEKLQNMVSFFPAARSLAISPNTANPPEAFISTTDAAWGETDFSSLQANGQVGFDPTSDLPGPLPLAVAASNAANGSHVTVFGNSSFASDGFFGQYGNGDVFLNSIDWSIGQEQLMSLSSPTPVTRTLVFTSNFWLLTMAISFLCLLPGLVIAGAVVSWLIRRSKG